MRKLNLAIALGLTAAIIGVGIVLAYGRSVDHRIADGRTTVTVLIADKTLAPGTPASELAKSVRMAKIPKAYVSDDALGSLDGVAAMNLASRVPAGAQLTKGSFAAAGSAAVQPSDGNVLVAVGVDIVPGVARYIPPNSLVDLFVTYPKGNTNAVDPSSGRTKLFASGIRVVSVSVAPERKDGTGSGASDEQTVANQVLAVLDVSPADAERIVNASNLGKLYLGLVKAAHRTPSGVTPSDVVQANR